MEDVTNSDIVKIMHEITVQAQKIANDHMKCLEKTIINDISDILGVNNLDQKLHIPTNSNNLSDEAIDTKVNKQSVIIKKREKIKVICNKKSHKNENFTIKNKIE